MRSCWNLDCILWLRLYSFSPLYILWREDGLAKRPKHVVSLIIKLTHINGWLWLTKILLSFAYLNTTGMMHLEMAICKVTQYAIPSHRVTRCTVANYKITHCAVTNHRVTQCTVANYKITHCTVTSHRVTQCTVANYKITHFTVTSHRVTQLTVANYKVTCFK